MSWLLFSHSLLKSLPIFLVIYLTAPLPLRSVVLRLLSLAEHTLDTCMSLSMLSQLPGPPAFPFCPNKAHVSLPRTVEVLHLCGSSTDYLNLGEFLSFLNFIALLAGNKSWVPPYALTYWASKSAVQSLSHVQLLVTPWTAACQASLSITNSGAYSNSCLLHQWCHPTISSSHLQSFPASVSFQMSQFFTSGGQSIGVSA